MIPTIYTPRLILRGFQPEDLEPLHAILSDREVIRYLPRSEPWPLEIVQKVMNRQNTHWETHGYGWYVLECQADHALIGWCGLGFSWTKPRKWKSSTCSRNLTGDWVMPPRDPATALPQALHSLAWTMLSAWSFRKTRDLAMSSRSWA